MGARWSWHYWLVISALAVSGAAVPSGDARAQGACPADSRSELLGDIALCIPAGNDRYTFEEGRVTLVWHGDEPAPRASSTDNSAALTVAIVPFSGDLGATLASTMLTPILHAAEAAGSDAVFLADVPIQGEVRRLEFERLENGALRGKHQASDKTFLIHLRMGKVGEQPHLAVCSDAQGQGAPSNTCLAFTPVGDRIVTMMIVSESAERSFRVSEEIASDLQSFAHPVP